ncbi:hypothetical protein [Macromonas nakdongensis]|uniref:hypothetical protein n=1 Tax=Macromonas nakdongensis TaxID=1843082 RepID=UPI000C32DB56|nr:hypothetical protein [Macromonas nakdongensis]
MTQPTRRVRAGRPPDNTGCLPVDYTQAQLDAWRAEEAAQASADRALRLLVAGYIAAIFICIAALAVWGNA